MAEGSLGMPVVYGNLEELEHTPLPIIIDPLSLP
jgi:hypothetical protein